ncbi:metalloprotease [Coprinopsis cinerea AmutBmut pab1-1]|nr:metalloprotease [Coprinopsis cinerea AmutBmut pab1-1]
MLRRGCLFVAVTLCTSSVMVNSAAIDTTHPRLCGSEVSAEHQAALEDDFKANKILASARLGPSDPLNVYFHVISRDESRAGGHIDDVTIQEQMEVLNTAFQPSGVQFRLVKVTRNVNPTWFSRAAPRTREQAEMKNQLREGGPADLNIYTVGFESGSGAGLLG